MTQALFLLNQALTGITDYATFCVAVLMFLMLPGPGTFTLLTSTAQGGVRAGMAAMVGLIVGDQTLLWLAVAGVAALLASHPAVFEMVRWGGALYLGWIGLKLLRAKEGAAPVIRLQPKHYARQAMLITVLNPKAIMFYMAFFPLFINSAQPPSLLTYGLMALTIASITALYCLTLSLSAHALSTRLRAHRQVGRWLERLAGVCLLGFGWRLLRD
jgi:leucine efflux protein